MSNVLSKVDERIEELKEVLSEIEQTTSQPTLADAIRMGSMVTGKSENWGDGTNACSLSAAVIGAKAAGWIE